MRYFTAFLFILISYTSITSSFAKCDGYLFHCYPQKRCYKSIKTENLHSWVGHKTLTLLRKTYRKPKNLKWALSGAKRQVTKKVCMTSPFKRYKTVTFMLGYLGCGKHRTAADRFSTQKIDCKNFLKTKTMNFTGFNGERYIKSVISSCKAHGYKNFVKVNWAKLSKRSRADKFPNELRLNYTCSK